MRRGIVVAVHPEDHSVDLVMADDGARLTGVQVLTGNGSTRSGLVDLPAMPDKKDKWDITQRTGQDMLAVVGLIGRNPVVVGFTYPQINQMTHKDPKLRVDRHQSDVMTMIDGDGNFQWTHPSGTYVRVGENPDSVDLTNKNEDASLKVDRNTDKQVSVRIGLAGGTCVITIDPSGAVTMTTKSTVNIEADGAVSVKAPSVTLDTPQTHLTGSLQVDGSIFANGNVTGAGISLDSHVHKQVKSGGDLSGPPD